MWQVITIITLLLLMVARQFFGLHGGAVGGLDPNSLAATGFIILAAFTMGELFKRLKMPALLGYIAAGIVFGPDLSQLVFGTTENAIFGRDVISNLALINVLTIGVIGTMGGGELKLAELKTQGRTILTVIALAFLAVVPLSAATVLALSNFAPDLIPFLQGTAVSTRMAVALLFGVFGFAMSPAATLAIIQETRAKGPFTSLTLGVVIVADLVLVAGFLLVFEFAQLLTGPGGITGPAIHHLLVDIGLEFGWALVIGVVTGALFIVYLRFVGREMLLFTVGIIFAAAAVADMVGAEKLLAFLTAGFVVQNFSKHGHDMIDALEKISLPVFVIYFMTQAAQLDLAAVAMFLPLAVILTVVRGLGLFGSVKMATRLRNSPEYIDSNLWMAFFSRGGVDIVLAGVVATDITGWGEQFKAVIMATVVIHIIAGPAILKWVFERVGETEEARKAGSAEVAELDRIVGVEHEPVYEPLERPEFPDARLDARLEEVSDALTGCYQSCLIEQIEHHGQRLRHMVERISTVREESVDDLLKLLEPAEGADAAAADALARRVQRLHTEFRQAIQPQIELLEHLEPLPVTPQSTDDLLERVRGLVDFEEHYRVRMEPWLLEPADAERRGMALVKAVRRFRRAYGRGGHRTVPLGRLWRFYLELSLPAYLASAVSASAAQDEAFWHHLGVHLHSIDEFFDQAAHTLRGEADDTDEPPASNPARAALEQARQHREELDEEASELDSRLAVFIRTLRERFSFSIERAYGDFIEGVTRAGTIELPAFRYRASGRYDEAHRAEARLRSRLEREASLVEGYRGWIVLDHQLLLFLAWFDTYQQRVLATLDSRFGEGAIRQMRQLESRCKERPSALASDGGAEGHTITPDWSNWFAEQIDPALDNARTALDHALTDFGQGIITRRLMDVLEARVARFSEQVRLLVHDPVASVEQVGEVDTVLVPLRAWFFSKLLRETALRLVEFNERAERILRRSLVGLGEVRQILDSALVASQQEFRDQGDLSQANEVAEHGLQDAAAQADELVSQMRTDADEMRHWVIEESWRVVHESTSPFLEHRILQVVDELRRTAQESLAQRSVRPLISRLQSTYRRFSPVVEQVRVDLGERLQGRAPVADKAQVRARLMHVEHRQNQGTPAVYRRLFSPVPVDIPDFYVERPALERECLDAVDQLA